MARTLHASVITEIDSGSMRLAFLTKFELDAGDINFWTGLGNITEDGDVYIGAGDIIRFDKSEETTALEGRKFSTGLSGIPAANLAMALSTDYQGRFQTVKMAFLDSSDAIIGDAVTIWFGRIDTMDIELSGETFAVIITSEHFLTALQRPVERRYTHEDQQIDFAGDLFFEFVPALQNKEITWG